MASWPTSVKSFTPVVNGVTKLVAALFNLAYDEIEAIETNLSGSVVQVVNTQSGAAATGTTIMPYDDTIPQITEGDEYMIRTITPKSATNILKIEVDFWGGFSVGNSRMAAALFQDAIANALKAGIVSTPNTTYPEYIHLTHYMVAGTTSEITFRVRAGGIESGTVTINGVGGATRFGGVMPSNITVTEIRV
jgi:hypothetical protein